MADHYDWGLLFCTFDLDVCYYADGVRCPPLFHNWLGVNVVVRHDDCDTLVVMWRALEDSFCAKRSLKWAVQRGLCKYDDVRGLGVDAICEEV